MVLNIFAGDSVQSLGAVKRQQASGADPKAALDGIAARHQVPANVIVALAEAGGADSLDKIEALALEAGQAAKAGKGFDALLRERGGDALLTRAYDIADKIEPQTSQASAEPSMLNDAARGAGGALARGVGGAADYLGRTVDRVAEAGLGGAYRELTGAEGEITPLESMGVTGFARDGLNDLGAWFESGISPEAQQAARDSMPKGNLLDPSTIKAPKDVSLRGLVQLTAQGIGSLAPAVVAGLASKNPQVAAGVMGAAMAGGDGRQTAGDIIDQLWNEKGADGAPRLAAESDLYRSLVQSGATPEQAYLETKKRAQDTGGDLQAIVGGAGGAVTGGIVGKGLPAALAGKSVAGNVARGVAASAIEEGAQEAVETMAARAGINAAAVTNLDVGEGTVEAAAAGAMAGGPFGALGAVPRNPRAAPQQEPAPAIAPLLALPAPTNGGTVISGGPTSDPTSFERQPGDYRSPESTAQQPAQFRNTGADGSGAGAAAAPQSSPLDPSAGAGAAAPPPPAGPIEAVSRLAPDLTPAPEAPPPPVMFPDQKPGAKLRLHDPETDLVLDGVFQREIPGGGAVVRVDGGEIELDAQTFDRSLNEAARRDQVEQAAPKAPEPKAESLTQKALAAVPKEPPARKAAQPQSAEQLAATIATIEARAAAGGWTPGLMKRRDKMRAEMEALSVDPETGEILAETMVAQNGPEQPADAPLSQSSLAPVGADAALQPAGGKESTPVLESGRDSGSDRSTGPGAAEGLDVAVDPSQSAPALTEPQAASMAESAPATPAAAQIEAAAAETNPEPSPAQAEAENYKTGKAEWRGFKLSIENRKGGTRRKVGKVGETLWEVTMPAHYGRILGTKGADGDHVDFYMGDNPDSEAAWVVDQADADTGRFDEHKVMLGFDTAVQAKAAYIAGFSDGKGKDRLSGIRKMTTDELADWLKRGDTTKPITGKAKPKVAKEAEPLAPQKADSTDQNSTVDVAQAGDTVVGEISPADRTVQEAEAPPAEPESPASDAQPKNTGAEVDRIRAAAETRDWWNNRLAPPTRASVLKDMGLFSGDEARIGERKWDSLSSAQQEALIDATAATRADRAKGKADQEAEARARSEASKAAKEQAAEAKRAEDLQASVGRLEDLRGGTARAVVDWGASSRYVAEAGFSGHGKFMLRDGISPDFEALVRAKSGVVTEGVATGIGRLVATAERARHKIDWRFVRNVQEGRSEKWKPSTVVGKVTKQSAKGADVTWVEIDRLAYHFAIKNGLEITAGDDFGIMALRKDDEMVGMLAPIRPPDAHPYDEMDRIASGEMPELAEPLANAAASDDQAKVPTAMAVSASTDKAVEPDPAPDAAKRPAKIEDFGEKIGGARKDMWSGFKEKMEEAERLDIAAEPLSKSWPEPDYEKLIEAGIDAWTVSFIRAARDMIPRKPAKSWRLRGWGDEVKTLRKFANDLLSGRFTKEQVQGKLAAIPSLNDKMGGRMALYDAVGHSKSLKDLSFGAHTYSMLNGERFPQGKTFWEVTKEQAKTVFGNMPKTLARAETREEALERFKAMFASLDENGTPKGNKGKGTKFLIYSERSATGAKWRIGVKIGTNHIDIRTGIEDVKEARRIVAEESDQLQEKLDRMRDIPNERQDENAPRLGADHRFGADVTPQQFAEAFGFRGVEFGNWVEDARRQEDLNSAFDGLMDLASILDLPPKAISLNGTLGLAFGARGSGGKNSAAAHYEPGKVVINLTKRSGRGSLAHEWFHAMDNYFAKQRQQMRGTFITDNLAPAASPANAGVRPEVIESFSAVKRAIMATDLKKRSENIDRMRTSAYWGTGIEMHARAFESYVIAKLQDQGASNDYLANVVNGTSWGMMAELSGLGDSYPYLKDAEIEKVRPAFDNLFSTIETRDTDRGVEMYMRAPSRDPIATLTGKELGEWEDMRQLGKKAEAWYRNNLIGKTVVNEASGMEIRFNQTGATKIGGRKGDILYRSVVALREIIAKGEVVSTEPDARGRPDIVNVHKIGASVELAGQTYNLIATVREQKDGTFHYDLSRRVDDGAKLSRDTGPEAGAGASVRQGKTQLRSPALEGNPVDLNIQFAEPSIKPVEVGAFPAISKLLAQEMQAHGLVGKISPRVVRGLVSAAGVPILGRQRGSSIEVNADAPDALGVMRHEIIHALRDPSIWGDGYGLFTQDEWQGLVKAARADKAITARVERAYADQSAAVRTEEGVAELYREWAEARDGLGKLGRILAKVQALFRGLASGLRGEGFTDAALIMERIASGRIGGRGPRGPGGGRRADMEKAAASTDTPEFKRWFGKSKVVDASGKPLVVYHGTRAEFEAFSVSPVRARLTAESDAAQGFFFASSQGVAATYSMDEGISDRIRRAIGSDKPRVEAVHLAIQNPYVFDMRGGDYSERVYADIIAAAKEAGHDGVKIKNVKDDGYAETSLNTDVWVAFRPEQIKSVFNRGTWNPDDPRMSEMRASLMQTAAKAKGMIGSKHWKRTPQEASKLWRNLLTDAMGRNETWNVLGLVPGRPLFTELGKSLPAAQEYLGLKERMDAERNDWQALSAETVDKWSSIARKNPEANESLMELMHDTTIAQIDPSKPDGWKHPVDDEARKALDDPATSKAKKEWARGVLADAKAREADFPSLQARFDRLPKLFREMYAEVRDSYSKLADAEEEAVIQNIRQGVKATLEQARREAKRERQRISDKMEPGSAARNEAMGKVAEKLAAAEARAAHSSGPWIKQLRQVFESNRLVGPYFPLSRRGEYFVAVRDKDGNLLDFQRFVTASEQEAFAESARKESPDHRVRSGVVDNGDQARDAGDPRFVADIEKVLMETGASKEAMDAVWQRYLETMPGQSMRKRRLHRKGTKGYNRDAMRAFASAMFHGAHQVARLRYGTRMGEALAVAKDQATEQKDANRAGFVVREMEKRHAFTMQPTNNPLVTWATSFSFMWYLAMSPAAALVNISQTTVVGIPLMRAHFKDAGLSGVTKALTKASHDFVKGRGKVIKRVGGVPIWSETWSIENAPSLTDDERKAMEEGYERGVIDKTQAHDLAAVAESGVEYNPTREKVMRIIGWGFHHTERFNREVTYLASYRLAREQGMKHEDAITDASRMTWNVHFDYANTSRPRAMQGDAAKVFLIFRNFSANMLYRLFRDTHQALAGASKEERAEARAQLMGISLSMFAHAGIRGVWGYGILMMLLGLFFPGGGEEADEWLQHALLVEGDSAPVAAWNWMMGMALNGAPGHVTGLNLTERMGMPNLWFRGSDRELEGEELWMHYLGEMAGPLFSIPGNMLMGASQIMEGHTLRGLEKMTPVFMRNPLKTVRYANEGVTTMSGDELIDGLDPWQMFAQANGFTPAEVAERYEINTRLKNKEARILDERKAILKAWDEANRSGEGIPPDLEERLDEFNRRYPYFPIEPKDIRQSVRSRQLARDRNEFGVGLNPKLNNALRESEPPTNYQSAG